MMNDVGTVRSAASNSALFDLTAASDKLWPATRRLLRTAVGVVVFLIAMGLIVLAASWTTLTKGSPSGYQIFDLSVIAIMVVAGVAILLRETTRRVRGAVSLRVDETGFELSFPTGKRLSKTWSDPSLTFELIDFGKVTPSVLAAPDFPYSIKIRGVESYLTTEAYAELLARIQQHQLIDETRPGGTWLYPPDASPLIHRVSSASRSVRDTGAGSTGRDF